MDTPDFDKSDQEEVSTDRIKAFSDGVFAIAITLLVLNIPVPHIDPNTGNLLDALGKHWSDYLSFLLSFIIVGQVWSNHHTMFSYIKRSNHLLIVFNLLLLMNIVVLPFAAVLLALYVGTPQQQTAVKVYSGVLFEGGIAYNLLWLYASWHHRLLAKNLQPQVVRQLTRRYLLGPPLYLLAFVLSFFWNGTLGLALCALLAIVYLLPTLADRVNVNRLKEKDFQKLRNSG